jgi:hypothetical protein
MRSYIKEEKNKAIQVFWLRQDRLIHDLYKRAHKIGSTDANVLKIILFGAIAERRGVPQDEAQILVLLSRDDKYPFFERIPEWIERFHIGFPLQVFPYTIDEKNTSLVKKC